MKRLVWIAAAAIACTDGGSSGTDGGPSSPGTDAAVPGGQAQTQACRYDDECPEGTACNGEGQCVAGQACDQDFHCNPGSRCRQGVCRGHRPVCAPCSEQDQCGEDTTTGLPHPCVEHEGRRVCALESSARECPAGMLRDEQGYCLPERCGTPMGCSEDSNCPQGTRCSQREGEAGLCVSFCRADSDCPDRGTCDTTTGLCRPPCTQESCAANQRCHDDGRCGAPCTETAQCPEGFDCRNERCRLPGCSSDADCPPRFGIYCDTQTRNCVEGCLTDDHCSSTQICSEGTCVPRPCRTKELDCNLGQFCCANGLDDSGAPCPDGVQAGACFDFPDGFCAACQNSDDCQPSTRHGTDSVCIEYQDRDGNALGKSCALGCRDGADCPRGFRCIELQNDQGQTSGKICTAALCVTGELPQR